MHQKTWELHERVGRFSRAVAGICAKLNDDLAARRVARRVSVEATAVDAGYRAACVSTSPEQFIVHIEAVARHAKRARALLQDMVQARFVSIYQARQLILEAKALEAIFRASRNTARRRRARPAP
jgi:hypothetical protein